MTACDLQAAGTIELYFYGELIPAERDAFERHLAGCRPCRDALDELATIRAALSARPAISAPPDGDWSAFMSRLDRAIDDERAHDRLPLAAASAQRVALGRRSVRRLSRDGGAAGARDDERGVRDAFTKRPAGVAADVDRDRSDALVTPTAADAAGERQAFEELSEEHFERSKLVVLGLATKDAAARPSARLDVRARAGVDAPRRHADVPAGRRRSRAAVRRRRDERSRGRAPADFAHRRDRSVFARADPAAHSQARSPREDGGRGTIGLAP